MLADLDFALVRDFGTALLLGGLLGIEREKRNARAGFGIAGLRSFVVLAEVGAIGGYLGVTLALPWLLPVILLAVTTVVVAGYLAMARQRPAEIGLTTELAAIVTCLLGALTTTGHRELAVGLGVTTAALLAYKQPLHDFVGRLAQDDVLVGLRLLFATFIVLPLLPDRAVDPLGAINPYKLWLLVLLISGLSLVGYVATRWLGPGRGIAITAASGGLVSSTAVTLTFVKQSREPGAAQRQLASGILLAWSVMFVRVLVAATIVHPPMLLPLWAPMLVMTAISGAAALLCSWTRTVAAPAVAASVPMKNPFSLLAAGKFAALFAAVLLLLRLAQQYLPTSGVYTIAALAGLTDVDAITLSMAEGMRAGGESMPVAIAAIVIAVFSNTLVKAGMAAFLGHGLARPVLAGTAAIVAGGSAALFLS